MGVFFLSTKNPEDWRDLLADPEKHWRSRYSAKALAYSWEEAQGFPPEITRLFSTSSEPSFQVVEFLLGFPEWQVPLPGGSRPSQNDLFVIAKTGDELVAIVVEGKVAEPFGPLVGEWQAMESQGKSLRLDFLHKQLGLDRIHEDIRYQLLHRAASAVMEARRFKIKKAVMVIHSFSQKDQGFEDLAAFLNLFNVSAEPGQLVFLTETKEVKLYSGWARGDARYLDR